MSIRQRCLSYRESNKGSKKKTGINSRCPLDIGIRLIESQIKGVKKCRDQFLVSVLKRCPSYRESNKRSKERQGPTLGVRFTEVSVDL